MENRLEIARTAFGEKTFSRRDYQNLLKTISAATASRDLHQGVKMNFLKRSGDRRTSVYIFNPISKFLKMLKVRIKYCGGCNPYYDRVALIKRIESCLDGKVEFVAPENDHVDFIIAVEGCKTACADLSEFDQKKIRLISRPEDAEKFFQEILK